MKRIGAGVDRGIVPLRRGAGSRTDWQSRGRGDQRTALNEPAHDDLGDGLAVRGADLSEHRVGEEVVPPFGERPARFDLHAALAHQLLVVGALEERVALNLVDGRRDLVVLDQIDETVG